VSFLVIALLIGILGAMLGIGGGVLIIPVLTLFFDVPMKTAIGASIVTVIATSSAAEVVYLKEGLVHARLGMILEIATTLGALAGGLTAIAVSPRLLEGLFGLVLLYIVYSMQRLLNEGMSSRPTGLLDTRYQDPLTKRTVSYGVRHLPYGLLASFLAGNISGLLGIGGGPIKVPIMVLVMGIPLKAAIATSSFMIGVTAATSAVLYYQRGYVDPRIAVPMALGVFIGGQLGSRLGGKMRNIVLERLFQVLLVFLAVEMLWKAVRG